MDLSKPKLISKPFSFSQKTPDTGASCMPKEAMLEEVMSTATIFPEASPANMILFSLKSMARTG